MPTVSGDVYVVYLGGKQANAEVYGEISKAANGEVAELYAQQFPYQQRTTQAGSVILHPAGGTARYEFQVTPTLATRYRVELFQSSARRRPSPRRAPRPFMSAQLGTSGEYRDLQPPGLQRVATSDLYGAAFGAADRDVQAAVSVLRHQPGAAKSLPPTPQWLYLGPATASSQHRTRISADRIQLYRDLLVQVGDDAYDWAWTRVPKATEAEDGIGLPGHHGCGDERVLHSASYLG